MHVKGTVAVGMQEGGLCLWDCEEAASRSTSCSIDGTPVQYQRPTYTTECHGTADIAGSIVSLAVLPQPTAQAGQSAQAQLPFLLCTPQHRLPPSLVLSLPDRLWCGSMLLPWQRPGGLHFLLSCGAEQGMLQRCHPWCTWLA